MRKLLGAILAPCMLVVFLFGGIGAAFTLPADEDVVQAIKGGNLASISSIVTFHTQFAQDSELNESIFPKSRVSPVRKIVGEYWHAGGKGRIREREGPFGPEDQLMDYDRMETTVHIHKNPSLGTVDTGLIAPQEESPTSVDIWEQALCLLPAIKLTVSQLLDRGGVVRASKVVQEHGQELAYLQVEFEEGPTSFVCELWADRSTNYLIRRVVNHVTIKGSSKK